RPALAGGVAALEHDQCPRAGLGHMRLVQHQLLLQRIHLRVIIVVVELFVIGIAARGEGGFPDGLGQVGIVYVKTVKRVGHAVTPLSLRTCYEAGSRARGGANTVTRPPDMDDPHPANALSLPQAALTRLIGYGPLLAGLAGVVLCFVLLGGLRPDLAILGLLVVIVLLALLPLPVVTVTQTVEIPAPARIDADEGAISAFAEALADPCFVLDRRGTVLYTNAPGAQQFPSLQPGR